MSVQRKPRENVSDKKSFPATTGKSPNIDFKSKYPFPSHSTTSHLPTSDWETRNLNGSYTSNRQPSNVQDISGGADSVQGYHSFHMDVWGRAPSDTAVGGQHKLASSSSPQVDMSQWLFGGNKVEQTTPPALDLSEFPTLSSTVSSASVPEDSNQRPPSQPAVSPQLSGYYSAAVGANRTKVNSLSNGKHANKNSFPSLNTNEESTEKWSDMVEPKSKIGSNDTNLQRNSTFESLRMEMGHREPSSAFHSTTFDSNHTPDDFGGNVSSWLSSSFGTKSWKDIPKHTNNNIFESSNNNNNKNNTTYSELPSQESVVGSATATTGDKVNEISLPHDTMDVYGIRGLLKLMSPSWRTEQPDYLLLTLGIDLTSLGLNLNSTEPLYLSFETPFLDMNRGLYHEPEYSLPECYKMEQKPPLLKLGHFRKFQLQTLFYIFYCMPRDALQILAAAELYQRDWRYHKDLKLWFTRAPGTTTPGYERNAFIYFDITTWERKPFHETNRNFLQGFLPQNVITEAVEHLVNSSHSSS